MGNNRINDFADRTLRRGNSVVNWLRSHDWRNVRLREVQLDTLLRSSDCGTSTTKWEEWVEGCGQPSRFLSTSPKVALLRKYQSSVTSVSESEAVSRAAHSIHTHQSIESADNSFGRADVVGSPADYEALVGLYSRLREHPDELIDFSHTDCGPVPAVRATFSSNVYQIIEGEDQLAAAWVAGYRRALVKCLRTEPTPLQKLALHVSQTSGRRELYQEIESPEFDSSWHVVRQCRTRLQMMERFLHEQGYSLPRLSVLDLACSYGWFVSELAKLRCSALGVERDPLALRIGQIAYGLQPHQFVVADVSPYLASCDRKFDVVLFLSILHHYVLGRQSESAEEVLRKLDAITTSCLFLDTGEQTEDWYRTLLQGWTPTHISEYILRHTSFRKVIPLGIDSDNRGIYKGNYGRTLFACVR